MSQPSSHANRPITVLLIDDEEDTRVVWTMSFAMEGMTAITASNGRDGLVKARAYRPHVVICDYMMPEVDGLDVCRAIRLDEHLRGTFIILWSAACVRAGSGRREALTWL
jgi:phosphoserine phosphatase RsbU/P